MAINIAAVGAINPAYTIPATQNDATANNNSFNVSALTAYEDILALDSQQNDFLTASDNSTSVDSGLLTSDIVSLSPQALDLLNGVSQQASPTQETVTSLIDVTPPTDQLVQNSALGGDVNSDLSTQQQAQIASILNQFSSAPLDQTTLNEIQTALSNAGINPLQLSLQDLILSANAGLGSYSDQVALDYQQNLT
jgi:hypothetical protein